MRLSLSLGRPVRTALAAPLLALGIVVASGTAQAQCLSAATHLCLQGARFQVAAEWALPGGIGGQGQAVPVTADTGLFWFFGNANVELMVKVLDGRAVNGHFWVYYGGLSDVEYRITVTDTATGAREIYVNPQGRLDGGSDVEAFLPEPPAAAPEPPPALEPTGSVPARLGPELQVNVTTKGDEKDPSLAIGLRGASAVVWTEAPTGVQGRFYDPAGRTLRDEVPIAPAATSPRVAADAFGSYLIVWIDGGRVKGRVYDAEGFPLSVELALAAKTGQPGPPDVAGSSRGGFLVAWPERADGSLHLRAVSSLGSPAGEAVYSRISLHDLRLASYPDGSGYVLAALDGEASASTVVAERLGPDGTLYGSAGSSGRLAGDFQSPVPVVHPDGSFSVVWASAANADPLSVSGLFARRHGANGIAVGGVFQLSAGEGVGGGRCDAIALPSGESLVLWSETGRPEDPDGGAFGRLYDAGWSPRGAAFRLNTYTHLQQTRPAVAADAAGTVIAAWESTAADAAPRAGDATQDGDGAGVFAQRFTTATCSQSASQLCLGGRFRVEVELPAPPEGGGPAAGQPVPLTADTGAFWFFQPSNLELVIKLLDGRAVNGHFWVFYGGLSDVEYTIAVTDTLTGDRRTYHNQQHRQASGADVAAFPLPADAL